MEFIFNLSPIDGLYTILLCTLIGIQVISNVPSILHTPLMSGSNAISGIIIIGGIIQLLENNLAFNVTTVLSCLGVLIGTVNVSGGFFVTHRMLKMFKSSKK